MISSLWQKLKGKLQELPIIGVSKRNFLMISADVRKGIVVVSYKGKVKYGYFDDKTLRNMMTNKHFDKNTTEFLSAVGQLIHKVTNE